MTTMLTREEAQQVLDALKELNKLSIGANAICLPAEIDDLMDTFRARLAQPEPEPLIKMKELLKVQGRDGNWNLDPYMQGMYNGMELIVALAEGRDPAFRKAPENWLSAQPQREWRGLTTAETKALWNVTKKSTEFAEMLQAKLKEKNAAD
jgi:hypothetical protein